MNFDPTTTTIAAAQSDMRFAYYGGAPGVLISAIVWLVAALVSLQVSPERAIWTLFVGGMLIHPVAVLLTKAIGRSASHRRGNPLGSLAMAGTFWLIMSLPLAYVVSRFRIDWFFPAMLLVIGGRYLTFSTMFGTRLYWACGGALALAGYLLARASAAPTVSAFTGAAIEALFAIVIFIAARRETAA